MLVPDFGRCILGDAYWEMHIFIETFVRSNWIILGFPQCCWGLQPGTPVPRCQDWSLCLKEAFLAAQKELLDFAAREGASCQRDDMGWPWMTYASCAKKWRRTHPYYIILLKYINSCDTYICNFVNLMVLYWQQRDRLVELQASIWKPRVPLGRCWFLRWGQWELPVEGKDAAGNLCGEIACCILPS